MEKTIDCFPLSAGDSEMVLVEELMKNTNDVYCERSTVGKIWPPTQEEKEQNPKAIYSLTNLIKLLHDEGINDRKISGFSNYVVFRKLKTESGT